VYTRKHGLYYIKTAKYAAQKRKREENNHGLRKTNLLLTFPSWILDILKLWDGSSNDAAASWFGGTRKQARPAGGTQM
jgi:hypothetical protein